MRYFSQIALVVFFFRFFFSHGALIKCFLTYPRVLFPHLEQGLPQLTDQCDSWRLVFNFFFVGTSSCYLLAEGLLVLAFNLRHPLVRYGCKSRPTMSVVIAAENCPQVGCQRALLERCDHACSGIFMLQTNCECVERIAESKSGKP